MVARSIWIGGDAEVRFWLERLYIHFVNVFQVIPIIFEGFEDPINIVQHLFGLGSSGRALGDVVFLATIPLWNGVFM